MHKHRNNLLIVLLLFSLGICFSLNVNADVDLNNPKTFDSIVAEHQIKTEKKDLDTSVELDDEQETNIANPAYESNETYAEDGGSSLEGVGSEPGVPEDSEEEPGVQKVNDSNEEESGIPSKRTLKKSPDIDTETDHPDTEGSDSQEEKNENILTGTCGDSVEWTLDKETKVLTLSGSGKINDYTESPWKEYSADIEEIIISEGVTSIGIQAFSGLDSLSTVTIADTVEAIGFKAFANCSNLQSVNIPLNWNNCPSSNSSGTTSSEYCGHIFEGCEKLAEITVPEGMEELPSYAFTCCEYLSAINLPSTITKIKNHSFYKCTQLKEITIPEGVTYIGKSAFCFCSNLKDVVIPEGVTELALFAFYTCTSLEEVVLPDSIEKIGYRAFADCTGLKNVKIPLNWNDCPTSSTDSTINTDYCGHIFEGCNLLEEIIVPDGMTELPAFAFCNCNYLKKVKLPDSMTRIRNHTFYNCTQLKEVNIPEGVTSIWKSAFCLCSSLKEVVIPEGVTELALYAFYKCTSLEEILMPDSIEKIGYRAFADCTGLKNVKIPLNWNDCPTSSTDNTINADSCGHIFEGCKLLEEITVPDGMTALPGFAFCNCNYLKKVNLPDSMTRINNHIFYSCGQLMEADIPDNVTFIGKSAFCGCSSLKNVIIPDGVTELIEYTLCNCSSLGEIDFNNITTIGENAVNGCSLLSKVTFRKVESINSNSFDNTSIGTLVIDIRQGELPANIFFDCDVQEIIVESGNSVYSSEEGVLFSADYNTLIYYPHGISSGTYIIPDGVQTISANAFNHALNLEGINIPASVSLINESAFEECGNLGEVNFVEEDDGPAKSTMFRSDASKGSAEELNIKENAFRKCVLLTTLELPGTVIEIGSYAFDSCSLLERVHFKGNAPEISTTAFSSCSVALTYRDGTEGWEALRETFDDQNVIISNIDLSYDRAIVMLLDRSWSMDGDPLTTMKQAAKDFCNAVLADKENSTALVVVPYCGECQSYGITSDAVKYCSYIDSISCGNSTDIYLACQSADRFLKAINANEKSIILLSDGIPVTGVEQTEGKYTNDDSSSYKFCNAIYDLVKEKIDPGYQMYTVGLFSLLEGDVKEFAERFMKDIQNSGFYLAEEVSQLNAIFSELSGSTFTITYDANGGTGAPDPQTIIYGENFTISPTRPFWKGYDFMGWGKTADATSVYQPGMNIAVHEDMTLYAIWRPVTRLTSTLSRFRANYNNLINSSGEGAKYSDYAKGLYKKQDAAVIPGLERTNMSGLGINDVNEDMVPQGVCVAGQYMLISAYHHHEEGEKADPSVIFVLDNNTKEYLTTLVLTGTTNRTFAGCHVGAMAYDKKDTVYLADSRNVKDSKVDNGKIWKVEFSKIDEAAQTGKDAVPVKVTEKFPVDINPSFLCYYGGNLLVGNFNKSSMEADEMMIYGTDGTPRTNKTIAIPGNCQGVGVTEIGKYTYMFCSCSYGAGDTLGVIPNYSRIIVYRFEKGNDGNYSVLLENKAYFGILSNENRFKLFLAPHMSEDIEIQGNTIFVCHESGANEYNARCPYPLDIITEGSVIKYLSLPSSIDDSGFSFKSALRKAETEFSGEVEVIDEGYCGDNAYYVLYSNGVMNITGGGAIYDYEGENPPWKSHLNEIRELYIGADISVIGSESFKGSPNLEKVEVSAFSNEDEILEIKDKAFDGCNNLNELVLPEKEYRISDDSFSSTPTVYSDDVDVLNYAQEKELQVHKHEFVLQDKVAPTCGTQGYSIYVCICGAEEYRDITDPDHSSHTYKEIDHVDATENTGGYTEYICTVCGEGKLDTTEPTGKPEEGATGSHSEDTTQAKEVKVSKITLTSISKQIAAGKSIQLTATVLPKNATNKKLKWTSSNTKVATVTQAGKVKIKKGTGGKSVTITAKAKDGSGKKAIFKIKVMKGAVKSIKIKGAKKTLKVGKKMKLKAVVKTTKGKPVNKKIKWTSDKPEYATVSSKGVVKAKKTGKGKKVKITAQATDGTAKKKVVTIKIK